MDPRPGLLGIAIGISVSWLPIFLRFTRAWRRRGYPTSLGIAGLVLFAMYAPICLAAQLPLSWPVATVLAIDTLSLITFYVALLCAARTKKKG